MTKKKDYYPRFVAHINHISKYIFEQCFKYSMNEPNLPIGSQSDHIKVWASFIGIDKRLQTSQLTELMRLVKEINQVLDQTIQTEILFISQKSDFEKKSTNPTISQFPTLKFFIEEYLDLFESLLLKCNIFIIQLEGLIQECQSQESYAFRMEQKIQLNKQLESQSISGSDWLIQFFKVSQKYIHFDIKVTAKDWIDALRKEWRNVEDKDTIILSNVLDNYLGGISCQNVAKNLEDWMIKNKQAFLKVEHLNGVQKKRKVIYRYPFNLIKLD